jgi:lantibiotic biosynthesis protein
LFQEIRIVYVDGMRGRNDWTPVVHGKLADEALTSVREIAAELLGREPEDPDLPGGAAGEALFFSYCHEVFGDEVYAEAAEARLEASVSALAEKPMPPGLHGGFCGIAWTVEHLLGGEEGEDLNSGIDEALARALDAEEWSGHYDLISGLVGIGVYFLERVHHPAATACLARIVTHLDTWSEPFDAGLSWRTPPALLPEWQRTESPEGHYDLGIAHGQAGIVAFLARMSKTGIAGPTVHRLLEGAVTGLQAHRLEGDLDARYPAWVTPGVDRAPTRTAWCYGDPGVSVALLAAAHAAQRPDWEADAVELALGIAARDPGRTGVLDAGLCHGAAGLAHLLSRLHADTDVPELGAAAVSWFSRTLDMRRSDTGVAGDAAALTRPNGERSWNGDAGLVTGAAGVGLALLAGATSSPPTWDRCLLI